METLLLAIILFLIYFYILGSVFSPQTKTVVETKTPVIVKTATRTKGYSQQIASLSHAQMVALMSKSNLNILPKSRKKANLVKTLNAYAQKHPSTFLNKYQNVTPNYHCRSLSS